MEINDLIAMLTEGLDDAEKATVIKAVQRDAVKAKAAGLKAETEFNKIMSERQALQQELEGDAATGKLGAKAYREWYEKNSPAAIDNDKKIREFDTKHGEGSFAKALAGELPVGQQQAPVTTTTGLTEQQVQALIEAKVKTGAPVTDADIQRMVDARIQTGYAPKWSELLEDTGNIVQRHMYAKREKPINFKEVSKIAQEKNIPMEAAYDVWDAPERERITKQQTEAEIDRRVTEGIQKANASRMFSAGADATPGSLSPRKEAPVFDRNTFVREQAAAMMTATDVTH